MSTPGFSSWQHYLGGAGTPSQSGSVSGPVQGFTSWQEYQQAGAAAPIAPAATVWDRLKLKPSQLPDDHARRMAAAAKFAPDSAERLMAMADMAVVGFPTFGEESYSYPGRELLREVVRYRGPQLAAALPGVIRKVATEFGQEPSIVEARMQTLGLDTAEAAAQEAMSGRAFTDILGFSYAEQVLPIARQGALMAVQRLQGTYDPATFDEGVSEMEERIASDGNQRALQMAANLGLYILPFGPKSGPMKILSGRPQAGVGANPLQNPNIFGGVEAVRFMGRIAEDGFGGAIVGELQDMGNAINPFAEDLAPSERFARVALAAMAVAGLTSGAADVRQVAREITNDVAARAPGRLGANMQRNLRASALTSVMEDALARTDMPVAEAPTPPPTAYDSPVKQAPSTVDFSVMKPGDHARLRRNFDLAMDDMPARDLVAWSALSRPFDEVTGVDLSSIRVIDVDAPPRQVAAADDMLDEAAPKSFADAAQEAEQRLKESGLAANEDYIHLDQVKAQTAHLKRLTFAREISSAEDMRQALVDSWGMEAKPAKAAAELWDARAQAWAEETGRPVTEWYSTRIASVGRAGDTAGRADEMIIEGSTVRFTYEGQYYQGKIGPKANGPLQRFGRIPVIMDDGSTWVMPLGNITDGVPDAVRVRHAHLETAKPLHQDGDAPALTAVHTTSAESLEALATVGRVEKPSLEVPNFEGEYSPRWTRDTHLVFDPEATIDRGPARAVQADAVRRDDGQESYRFDPTDSGPVAARDIRAIVVPDDARQAVPQALLDEGARVYTYDPATQGDRQRVLAQAETEVNALYQAEQTAKAAIWFDRNGKAILRAMKNPDVSTAIHELGHVLRRDAYRDGGISVQEQAALEKWAGVKDGKWTEAAEEKFARAFERYVRNGKAPARELRGLFERLKKMLKRIYVELTGSPIDVEISPEVQSVFDNLLGKRAADERARLGALEEEAERMMIQRRDELLSIMPDDDRLDIWADEYDDVLATAIKREFGSGAEDTRTPSDILKDAQDAAEWAYNERMIREDYRANFYAEAVQAKDVTSQWGSVRWYRQPDGKWRSDARHHIYAVDQRQIPEHIREAVVDWATRFYNDPEYYGDPGNTSGKGQPIRPRRMSEIVAEGEDIPYPVYEAWLETIAPADLDDGPLYQAADGPNVADLALVAAKRIAEGMAEETVVRMLVRDFKQKPGRAALIYRRAHEELARPDIDRVYRETGSRAAVAQMLEQNHPRVVKSRYATIIRETLTAMGEGELNEVRRVVDQAFEANLPEKAAPVAEAIMRGDRAAVDEQLQAGNVSGRQRQRILSTARQQVAETIAPLEWEASPSLDRVASVMAKRLGVSEPQAMELTRAALDSAGVDYTAELKRQAKQWLENELEPAVGLVWEQMQRGYTFDEAFSNGKFGRAAGREAVRAKIMQLESYDRIAEVYNETSSFGAVKDVMRQEFAFIPAALYREVFQKALAANGIEVATAPLKKLNPVTKRREVVEGKRVVVIGANEVVVPQSIVQDIKFFKERHPFDGGMFWNEGRYVERITDRNETAYRWIVEHRERAVTDYTTDIERWRNELKAVYGKRVDDKKFRQLVMDWAENKMAREDGLLTEGVEFKGQIIEDVRSIIRNQYPDLWQEVERVAEWHRATYDLLLDRQNEVRRNYGMGEIPRRNDYMAHIQEEATAIQKILQFQEYNGGWLPIGARRNTPYNQHAKQRKGQRSRRDSLANTEDYIDSALRTIHFTDAAIRRRTLAKVLQESEYAEYLGKVIQYFQNQANELVGQPVEGSDAVARVAAGKLWDGIVEAVRWTSKRTALNGLVGNLRTAVMQTGSLPQVVTIAGTNNVGAAAMMRMQIARGLLPDPVEESLFMKRRYGYSGRLSQTKWDKAIQIGAKPMEIIEKEVAEIVWTAFHLQANREGLSFDESVKYADKMADRTLGGRAIGEKPYLFNTDAGRVFFQFQLEVNNMVLLARHDAKWNELTGRNATPAERWKRAATYTVAAYIANSLYYEAFGDRPLPDPIDLAFDLNGIATKNSKDNDYERAYKVGGRIMGEIVSSLPGGTAMIGAVLDEQAPVLGTGLTREEFLGRTPAGMYAGTLPTSSALRNALKGETMGDLAWNLTTTLGLPFGGRQLNKTATGIEALANGGTVTDKQGRERYTIEGLVDEARALLFGPNATKAAQSYYDKQAGGQD